MSKPPNSAARNTMTPMERQCYDWGWEDAEERIIKLLDTTRICTCKPECITDINIVAFVIEELGINLIDLIKGEQK